MNDINCKIIEDLLPLYVDGVCSDESKILVSEHLDKCEGCAKLYKELMSKPVISAVSEDEKKAVERAGKKLKKTKKKSLIKGIAITLVSLIVIGILIFPDVMIAFAKKDYLFTASPLINMQVYNHKDGEIKVGKVKLNVPEKYSTLPNGLKIERTESGTMVWMSSPNQLNTDTNQRIMVFDTKPELGGEIPSLDFSTETYGGQPGFVRFMDRIGVKKLGFGVDDYYEFMYYLYSSQEPPKYSFFSSFSKKAAVFAYYNCKDFMVAGANALIAFDTGEYRCYGYALQGTADNSFDSEQAGSYVFYLFEKGINISIIGFTQAEAEYIMSSLVFE